MIKVGSIVSIRPSEALKLAKLTRLAGREAEIVEILTSIGRLNKGYNVKLTESYLGEELWFIPAESIEDEDE
ncbi:hypothetical protein DW228_18270 [Bacteroides fragilis]|uniref:Uncharacterized protein n=1 Tax=Bacteroides fragilis TaxID=817 RepID=A0A396BPG4_BACFG|nr:hypothetical protein [Bacteroides fragilis]RHH07880.1 hypothetical protein DW228_18270 [Bacteroides fragilis]